MIYTGWYQKLAVIINDLYLPRTSLWWEQHHHHIINRAEKDFDSWEWKLGCFEGNSLIHSLTLAVWSQDSELIQLHDIKTWSENICKTAHNGSNGSEEKESFLHVPPHQQFVLLPTISYICTHFAHFGMKPSFSPGNCRHTHRLFREVVLILRFYFVAKSRAVDDGSSQDTTMSEI